MRVLSWLFLASGEASATALESTDISARQRCVCAGSYHHTRMVHYGRQKVFRRAYAIGYDVLPYRFGSTFVWEPPYRYYR